MGYLNELGSNYYSGNNHGNYQFVSLDNIIKQFMIVYVGENKIIPKAKRLDVAFHAQRALAELSFDTFKSFKSHEITVPATLQMTLPQDYVNYTKISWVDSAGIKHLLYPTSKTSNPTPLLQNADGDIIVNSLVATGDLVGGSSSVTLDTEYKNIEPGMTISGPYIPFGTLVATVSNDSGVTRITMENSAEADVTPVVADATGASTDITNAGTTLLFTKQVTSVLGNTYSDNVNIYSEESSHIVEGLSWGIGSASDFDFKITGTASTYSNIKIGMLVVSSYFPKGTIVTSVSGTTIVVDTRPDNTSAITDGEITFISTDPLDSTAWSNYKSTTPSENNNDDYEDDTYWPVNGERYGLDPQHAQANGSFYIDQVSGKIHFSSNISGKTVILDYISDSLGTEGEMQVHKFAEEAMYKWISHAILAGMSNIPEYQVNRFKKERFAAIRQAKLRLSNIKLEEITQILRGKSKQIKH